MRLASRRRIRRQVAAGRNQAARREPAHNPAAGRSRAVLGAAAADHNQAGRPAAGRSHPAAAAHNHPAAAGAGRNHPVAADPSHLVAAGRSHLAAADRSHLAAAAADRAARSRAAVAGRSHLAEAAGRDSRLRAGSRGDSCHRGVGSCPLSYACEVPGITFCSDCVPRRALGTPSSANPLHGRARGARRAVHQPHCSPLF